MTSPRTGVLLFFALCLTTFCTRSVPGNDAGPELVGDHGDVAQLVFQGDWHDRAGRTPGSACEWLPL